MLLPCIPAFAVETHLELTVKLVVDGQPLPGVSASLMQGSKVLKSLTSGSDGRVVFSVAYNNNYELKLVRDGYITTTVQLNAHIPGSMMKYNMEYTAILDMFAEKEGFEARLASSPVVKVAYIPSKENFGMTQPYVNSVKYHPLPEKKEAVVKEEKQPLKEETATETVPNSVETEEEKALRKESAEKSGAAERALERAEVAGDKQAADKETVTQERAVAEKLEKQREVAVKKEALGKINDRQQIREMEDRQAKARVTQKWREDLSKAVNEEKQKKTPTPQ